MAAEGIMIEAGGGERIAGKGLDVVLMAPMDRDGIREILGNAFTNGTGEGNG